MVTLEAVDGQRQPAGVDGDAAGSGGRFDRAAEPDGEEGEAGAAAGAGRGRRRMDASSVPANPEAYGLYMRSSRFRTMPGRTRMRSRCWRRRCSSIPNYAPAWEALGHRYYYDAVYSGGGDDGYRRSSGAYRKALALEPGRTDAAGSLAINLADTGNLEKGLEDARALVRRRPDNAFAHFSLGYVARYAGCWTMRSRSATRRWRSIPRISTGARARLRFLRRGKRRGRWSI